MANIETLNIIKNAAAEEADKYHTTLSTLRTLASNLAITWDDVERMEQALAPYQEKVNEIIRVANKAIIHKTAPRLPFAPAPKAPTPEEIEVLDEAWKHYLSV